jgi:hypothetical protein
MVFHSNALEGKIWQRKYGLAKTMPNMPKVAHPCRFYVIFRQHSVLLPTGMFVLIQSDLELFSTKNINIQGSAHAGRAAAPTTYRRCPALTEKKIVN